MSTVIKERRAVKNPNYPRFYEFNSAHSDICASCPAKCGSGTWEDVLHRVLGTPVHTNWHQQASMTISHVYICESPSNREFSHGLPSVGLTAHGILKNENREIAEGWLDWLDDNIYRTNLVRCAADSGLQKRVGSQKDRRVREAAEYCIKHLQHEIQAIVDSNQERELTFYIAIGTAFPTWHRKVESIIHDIYQGIDIQPIIEHGMHFSS